MVESSKTLRAQRSPDSPNPGFDLEAENPESIRKLEDRIRHCMKIVGGGAALAQKAGIPRSSLETYLTGQAEPKVGRVVAIADAAGVSIDWLATGRGEPEADLDQRYSAGSRSYAAAPGVAEQDATGGLDHLDEGLLVAAVSAVDEYLERRRLQLDSKRKGELIGLLYDIVFDEEMADRQQAISKNVTRLFKLVS